MEMNDFFARLAEVAANRNAQIAGNIQGREALLQKVYLDLTTARSIDNAQKISVPFKSVTVEGATDTTTNVYIGLGDNSLDAMQNAKLLKANDSFEFDSMVSSAYVFWGAQAGKSLSLVFATTGSFKPGSQISQLSGGISISDGSALSSTKLGSAGTAPSVTVTSATPIVILPADTDRKNATLFLSQDCWVGDASVAVGTRGIYVSAGYFEWRSTAILYAIAVAGDATVTGNDTR